MPKKHPIADQFSDDDMNQIKHMGQMLHGGVTPFDEAVEEALNKRQAAREASAGKMHAAQTGGGDPALGPSQMDQQAVTRRTAVNQQADLAGTQQAEQAKGEQVQSSPPPAPTGPQGTTIPFSAQQGAVGGAGNLPKAAAAAPPPPPAAPAGPPPDEESETP